MTTDTTGRQLMKHKNGKLYFCDSRVTVIGNKATRPGYLANGHRGWVILSDKHLTPVQQ